MLRLMSRRGQEKSPSTPISIQRMDVDRTPGQQAGLGEDGRQRDGRETDDSERDGRRMDGKERDG